MLGHRRSTFESLEKRLALAVSATVTNGDLVVTGDADVIVAITSTGSGGFTVNDNGTTTTLSGVTRNIKIDIDQTAGADNTVTVDLGTQAIQKIYADLGNGTNSLSVTGGSAKNF